jgi:hypothetical protein
VCNLNSGFARRLGEWFNASCYQLPADGTAGQVSEHALYSEPLLNSDSAISKQWPFKESRNIEFRVEFFNFLNGHTFDASGSSLGSEFWGGIERDAPAGS